MCRRRGWGVAFVSLRESDLGRPGHQRRRHFYFGDEAVVSCSRFELAGKKNKSLRQSVQRVARDHEFAMIPEHDAGRALSTQLQTISEQWLDGAPERGFSMSLCLPVGHGPHDAELCVAFDEAGDPAGFLRMLPTPGSTRTFTLDLMRRKRKSPNGLNEFLIVRTIEALRERGIDELSLNFATFGRLYQADRDLSVGERVIKAAVAPFNRFLPFQSLHEFNRRFRPEWVSRVLAYDHHGQLPFIAVVYFGLEGYLSLPLIGRFFEPDQTIDITRPIAMPARSDTTLEAIIGLRVAADGTIDLRDELLAVSDSHEGAHSDR
jgi:lysyl-tRNA synthetase class 2